MSRTTPPPHTHEHSRTDSETLRVHGNSTAASLATLLSLLPALLLPVPQGCQHSTLAIHRHAACLPDHTAGAAQHSATAGAVWALPPTLGLFGPYPRAVWALPQGSVLLPVAHGHAPLGPTTLAAQGPNPSSPSLLSHMGHWPRLVASERPGHLGPHPVLPP